MRSSPVLSRDSDRAWVEVRLFGSYARGEAHEDSDVECLVLLESVAPDDERAAANLAGDLTWQIGGTVMSPLVMSTSAFAAWKARERRTARRSSAKALVNPNLVSTVDEHMSSRLQVLISPSLDRRLGKAAARARVSKGEWVRRAIEAALADPRAATAPIESLARLGAPTGDIEQILAEIESGRG